MRGRKIRKNKFRKKSYNKKIFLILFVIIIGLGCCFYVSVFNEKEIEDKGKAMYLANETNLVSIFKIDGDNLGEDDLKVLREVEQLPRGVKVIAKNKILEFKDEEYQLILIDDQEYYVNVNDLVMEKKNVVLEDSVFVRTPTTILENMESSKINGFALKGQELQVVGYEGLRNDGNVLTYKVSLDNVQGYVYHKYMSYTREEALMNYEAQTYDVVHGKIKNTYGGGEALGLDFYPNVKPSFDNNIMPDNVYALYLNCGSNVINNIDAYIELAKGTNINAFVVDIKDNESPAWPAKVFEELSPTNYSHAINSYDSYKKAISKLKEAGFYVIGRITVFKDSYYIMDNPEMAIIDNRTGSPYLHNGSYWPSPYNRDVWYYTLSLAKEAVVEFGFDEINFDYVRFPDRMNSVSDRVDLKNNYNEDKVQAIQRFVQYVTDALHELEVYVSIDVFGETTNGSYTTAYGQYWPAISNVSDVICGMPYPDHFAAGSYGISKPWNNPYQLMYYWGSYASDRQKEIPTPANVRTWIQAYDVGRYVDSNGISYGSNEVEQEIRGLYDSGLYGGYMTWLSNSSLTKYRSLIPAFSIDYGKEYNDE